MHLLSALGPAGPAPSAALLARFDRVVPRNLALPPLETFARSLSAADLGEALARRGRPVGPARDMPVHLLVGLPCDACLGGDRTLAAIVREVRGLAEALGTPQDVARVTFQACDGMTMGDRRLGIVLDAVRTRFRAVAAEVCVEVARVDLPTLRDWRAAGATRVLLAGPSPDALSVARACEIVAVAVSVDCGRRSLDGAGLAASLRSLQRVGVARIDLGTRSCVASADTPACRDAARPTPPHARRAAMRALAVDVLSCAGFRHAALGLFVQDDDPLLAAADHGRLHLEVDGLGGNAAAGTLAVGPGVFGRVGATFYRNAFGPAAYADAVDRHALSVAAGVALSHEALAARAAVESLVCSGRVDFEAIALSHLIEPKDGFVRTLRELAPMVRAGLVDVDADGVELTPQGRHLAEVVAAAFEAGRA